MSERNSMNFRLKIFFSILLVSFSFSLFLLISTYCIVKKYAEDEFISRYKSLGNMVANTFGEVGKLSDQVNRNAATIVREINHYSKIPSSKELGDLAKNLGIQGFYVINKQGKFIRSSDLPVNMQKNSLFSYCSDYRKLTYGAVDSAETPIVPSYPYDIPAKFYMVPSKDRNLIFESGIHLSYISEVLNKTLVFNNNVKSIGLYSPNGYELGFISKDGKFLQGKNNVSPVLLNGVYTKGKSTILNMRIPSVIKNCCECKIKKVANMSSGPYYYILRLTVSRAPLIQALLEIKIDFLFFLSVVLAVDIFVSKILSDTLVRRLYSINNTMNEIITTGILKKNLVVGKNNDELTQLANNFNKMILALAAFKASAIEYEKAKEIEKISRQVAHDIYSPLASIDIIIKRIPNLDTDKKSILHESLHQIREIINNLRKSNSEEYEIKKMSLTNIPELIDQVISERRVAFSNHDIRIFYSQPQKYETLIVNIIPSVMKRILVNIFNNACESVLNSSVEINVCLTKSTSQLFLSISDNGSGISNEILNSIFLRGFTTKINGSGLGLSHAKEKLLEWRGDINIISNSKSGVTVTITLPLVSCY